MEQKELTDREKIAMLAGYYLGAHAKNKNRRRSRKFMNDLKKYGQSALRALLLGGFDNPLQAAEALRFYQENISVNQAL